MPVLDTPLGPIAYDQHGSGPPLVLLHSNPGDRRDYDGVLPDLARDHRVLRVDWPGYGETPAPSPPSSASAMRCAQVLTAFVEGLALPPAVMIGNSVGGYAAARLAIDHPARVRGLVLVDSGGFTPHTFVTRAFCSLKGSEWVTRKIAGRFARFYLKTRNELTDAMIERARSGQADEACVAVDAATWRSFKQPSHDLRQAARSIVAPTLLVWGKRDPNLPPHQDGREARNSIAHATWAELDTGHCPFAEDPAAFLAVLRPFLASLDASACAA